MAKLDKFSVVESMNTHVHGHCRTSGRFKDVAKLLFMHGNKEHINHIDCPAGTDTKRRLYLELKEGLVLAYCHHCASGAAYAVDTSVRVNEEDVRTTSAAARVRSRSLLMGELHPKAMHYLRQYVSESTISWAAGEGYIQTPDKDTLVYIDPVSSFHQARNLDHKRFLSVKGVPPDRTGIVFRSVKGREGRYLWLFEDPISAMKCAGQVCQHSDALALCGTTVNDYWFEVLLNERPVIWFDADEAGQVAADKLSRRLSLYGIKHLNLTDKTLGSGGSPKNFHEFVWNTRCVDVQNHWDGEPA